MSEIASQSPQPEKEKEKKKSSSRSARKRRVLAALLGLFAGVGSLEVDHKVTGGLLADQTRSIVGDPQYRSKLWDSITSGEVAGDFNDLWREAFGEENESTIELGESFISTDAFLGTYFSTYEVRVLRDSQTEEARPFFLAEIDNPAIMDFNVGSEENLGFDPWVTAEQISPFATLPTNQSNDLDGQRQHDLYSAYSLNGKTVEYPDIVLSEKGKDPFQVRAGALVLFSQDGRNSLRAVDGLNFTLRLGQSTPHGTVMAIESYSGSISNSHESSDIEGLKRLKGKSGLSEYTRKNYNAVIVTYAFADGTARTYAFGLYTNIRNIPAEIRAWDSEEQLSPQDFYALVKQYGKELQAQNWIMLLPDPGPSSNIYDAEQVLGDVTRTYHSDLVIRPRYSLVQKSE